MQYANLIIEIDNPNIVWDSNVRATLYLQTFELELDGVRYSLDNKPNAFFSNVTIANGTNGVKLSWTIATSVNGVVQAESIIPETNIAGKSLKVKGVTGAGTGSNLPDGWAQYVTTIGSSFSAVITGSNITTLNNPSITGNIIYYDGEPLKWTIYPDNPIRLRADDGYTFDLSNIVITSNNRILNEHNINVRLEDNGKELVIDNVLYVDWGIGLQATYSSLVPTLNIQAVPISVPNENIVNNLTNVINSNPATSVLNGARYQATLSGASGYYVSNVIITMNGIDITNDVYNNGEIDIPSVTGEVVINAFGRINPSITNTLSHCTNSNSATSIQYGTRYQGTITADNGYSLEGARVLITMGGVEQYDVYNNGVIDIPSVTGDLVILVEAITIKTFTFKSMDGLTTYATYNAVKIRSIRFELNGNTRTLIVNGTSIASWVVAIPTGKQLYGLALTPNAERWTIPVNAEIVVNYAVDTTFYEVILDEGQEADTTSMILYKNSSDAHRVDKTDFLEYVGELAGVFRAPCSIVVPEVVIESMKSSVDCHVNFFGNKVEVWATYLIMILTDLTLIGAYILLCKYCKRKKAKKVKSK